MRYSVLLAALAAAVTAMPLGSDAATPVEAAIAPRSSPNPEYVSLNERLLRCNCRRDLVNHLTVHTYSSDCLHHRLHERMRHQPAPMHAQMRAALRCSVSSDPAMNAMTIG